MFVFHDPTEQVTAREQALRTSAVRSHVARVTHSRKVKHRRSALHRSKADPKAEAKRLAQTKLTSSWHALPFRGADGALLNSQGDFGALEDPLRTGTLFQRFSSTIVTSQGTVNACGRQHILRATGERPSSTWQFSSGLRVDPFGYISREAAPMIDYFTQALIPHQGPAWKVFNVANFVPQSMFEVLLSYECFPAAAAAVQARVQGLKADQGQLPKDFVRYRSQALINLRKRLSHMPGPVDELTIVQVGCMLIAAIALGDHDSWRIHTQNLGFLVEATKGFEHLEHASSIKSLLLQSGVSWAYNTGQRVSLIPAANPINGTQSSLDTLDFLDDSVRKMIVRCPAGIPPLIDRRLISLPTLTVISRAVDASDDPDYCQSQDMYHHSPRPYHSFWEACPCLVPKEGGEEHADFEQLFVQALLLYCLQNFTNVQPPSGLFAGTRNILTRRLVNFRPSHRCEEDALVWIYMNAVDAWRNDKNDLQPSGQQLMKLLWPKSWFVSRSTLIRNQLRLFFSKPAFEERCLRYVTASINVDQLRDDWRA
jgi:hypothetical protein